MNTSVAPVALAGKRIVVIGGTAGLGLSAVKAFVAAGARVVAVGLKPENVANAQHEVGEAATMMCGDASVAGTGVSAVAKAVSAFGGLDGLYHVAGGSGRRWGDGPLHEITDEGWDATFKLNLTSLFYSNRAAVRQFLAQGVGGTILNMGSVLGFSPSRMFFATHAYATTKAAVEGFTKSCAGYYAPQGIRFNVLAPAADGPTRRQRRSNSRVHQNKTTAGWRSNRPAGRS
jgi:NAD(P)-dependent dehydrogenase (short-subunit alcohol dehydrogenase family)